MSSDAGSIPAASTKGLWRTLKNREKRGLYFLGLMASLAALPVVSLAQPTLKVSVVAVAFITSVTIASSAPLAFKLEKSGEGLQFRLESKTSYRFQGGAVRSRLVKSLGWSKTKSGYILLIDTGGENYRYDHRVLRNPNQVLVDFYPAGEEAVAKSREPDKKPVPREEKIQAKPQEPSMRPLAEPAANARPGMRTVVIDPGHGGQEVGAKGKFGTLEKDVTLSISLKLKALIEQNLAFRVLLTRDNDLDVSLDNRAALANNNKADLFISVHANGSFTKSAHGSETFFLSLNATDEETRRLAYMENSSARLESQIDEDNPDDIKLILWDMAQSAYIKQSSKLAELIQNELNAALGTENRGLKQAPFKVLTGVACPAVLVEAAFISNPNEEEKLKSEDFQARVAEAIFRGLAAFLKTTP